MKLNSWFERFIEENNNKSEINYTDLVSQKDSISDGINHLAIPKIYRRLICEAIKNSDNINGYTQSEGHPLLVYGLQYYERMLAGLEADEDGFADYVRITAGATAAIQMSISYYANTYEFKKALIIGMSYYLFDKACEQQGIEKEILCDANGLCPRTNMLCKRIEENKGALVILTQPANPTGELYSEEDLKMILSSCKESGCILLLDLCQYDEMIMGEDFLNVNKTIYKANAGENVWIINSISKIRAIAGARMGYIVTQDEFFADYIRYCNEMFCFNHALGYENAVFTDIFYRIVLRAGERLKKKIIRNFRNIALQTVGVTCYQRVFKDILHSETLMEEAADFKKDIDNNMKIINNNYRFCIDNLSRIEGVEISELKGGYNFCVSIPKRGDEKSTIKKLSERAGTNLLSQKDFCYPADDSSDRIWIRIISALELERFQAYIIKIKEWIENE